MRYILFFLLLASYVTASENILEARFGYFRFQSQTARDIYGSGTFDIEAENIYKFNDYVGLWANFNANWKGGRSLNMGDKTSLYLYTLSLGPKFFLNLYKQSLSVYIGAGATGAYLQIEDDSPYVDQTMKRGSFGGVGKFGFLISPFRPWVADLFFDYYYQSFSTSSSLTDSSINLGGFRTGIGIGYSF